MVKITSEISEKVITDDKHLKLKNRLKESMFLLTINTNKSFNGKRDIEHIKVRFTQMIRTLFSDKFLPKLLKDLDSKEAGDLSKVEFIDSKSQIERGPQNSFLHSHTLIKVRHRSRIQVRLKFLKNIVYKYMREVLTIDGEFKKPYIHVKAFTNTQFELENYVTTGKKKIIYEEGD